MFRRFAVLSLIAGSVLMAGCGRISRQPGNDQGYGTTNTNIPRPHPGTYNSREYGPYDHERAPVTSPR